jgi:hypothetical protein
MMANLILYPFGFEDISRLNDSDILEIFRLPTGYETIIKKIYALPQNRNIQLTDASIEILTRNPDPKNPITITTYTKSAFLPILATNIVLLAKRILFRNFARFKFKSQFYIYYTITQFQSRISGNIQLLESLFQLLILQTNPSSTYSSDSDSDIVTEEDEPSITPSTSFSVYIDILADNQAITTQHNRVVECVNRNIGLLEQNKPLVYENTAKPEDPIPVYKYKYQDVDCKIWQINEDEKNLYTYSYDMPFNILFDLNNCERYEKFIGLWQQEFKLLGKESCSFKDISIYYQFLNQRIQLEIECIKTTLFSPGGKLYKITNNEKTVKINVLTDKIMQDIFGSVSNIKFIT